MTLDAEKDSFRKQVVRKLLFRPTFFSAKEILFYLEELLEFLKNEDEHLIKTGLPSKEFEYWYCPFATSQNLYFSKIPYDTILSGKLSSKDWKEALESRNDKRLKQQIDEVRSNSMTSYVWMNYPPDELREQPPVEHRVRRKHIQIGHHNRFGELGYWITNDGQLFTSSGRQVRVASYVQAQRLPWLTLADARRLEEIRPKLLTAKSRILNYSLESVQRLRKLRTDHALKLDQELIESCAVSLLDELGSSDLDFCSSLEERYVSQKIFNFGGIFPLFRMIGFIQGLRSTHYAWCVDVLNKFRVSEECDFPVYRSHEIPDGILKKINDLYSQQQTARKSLDFYIVETIEKIFQRSTANYKSISKKKKSQNSKQLIKKKLDFKWSRVRISASQEGPGVLIFDYDGRAHSLSHLQLGLVNKKTGSWNQAWQVLLRFIANNGAIPTSLYYEKEENSLRPQIWKIRKALKRVFGTNADPFYSNTKHTGVYKAKFLTGNVADLKAAYRKYQKRESENQFTDYAAFEIDQRFDEGAKD